MSAPNLEQAIARPLALAAAEMAELLRTGDAGLVRELFRAAREVKAACGRDETLPRGLVECSNVCAKDCLYCGIRRGNASVPRYRMDEEEVLACVAEAKRRGYPAVALQAGEIESEANTRLYERLLSRVEIGEVTLSLGEQTEEVYRRWREAAGDRTLRYLLRIETSNRALYARLHPRECSFDRRVECLRTLKRLGYVTGSGVMIGLPGQGVEELAEDLVFFGRERLDMVGMGPFIPHPATPLAAAEVPRAETRLDLALRMIALARVYLHDVNIVAATALEALAADGRERGLSAGANVVMPNLTPARYRADYDLYPGKSGAGAEA